MVVPTFSSLSSSMLPPIRSTMSFTMESPKPDPVKVVVVSLPSWEKGSKARAWNSRLMPKPVSAQVKRYVAVSSSLAISMQDRCTSPPGRLYLMAFDAMFISTRFRCSGLPTTCRCTRCDDSAPPVNTRPFSVAFASTVGSVLRSTSPRLNGLCSSSSAPDSNLLISSTLFTRSIR